MLSRIRSLDRTTARWLLAGVLLVVIAAVPLLVSGPGNDLDVANVFRSGRAIALHGDYLPSRAPGAPVQEIVVGVSDRLGGPLLANLASLAAAVVFVVALDRLLAGEGIGTGRRWAIAVLVANPYVIIAATSAVDYLFALAFVSLAALALRRGRPVWAGVAAAAAMGCRIGSALLIGAILLAELTDGRRGTADLTDADPAETDAESDEPEAMRADASPWRRVLVAGAVAAVGTVATFIPSFVHAGGMEFAQNDFRSSGPLNLLGRAAVKDLMLLGPIASLVALAAVPAIGRTLRTWRVSWLVRFAVPAFVLSQVLFIRFPWKMPHLLPCLLALVIVLAVALADRPRLLMVLVGLQLLYGVVAVRVVEPNKANAATSAKPALSISWGPVVTDWRCRREHPDPHLGRQKVEVEAAWNCSQPFDR